jgi:hypothetical protein
MEYARCFGVERYRPSQAGANRLEHRVVGIAVDSMKLAIAERGRDRIGFMSDDNDHFIANWRNRIERGGNQGLWPVRAIPHGELLCSPETTPAAGC